MGGGDVDDDDPTSHASDTRRCCGGLMAMMRWPNVFQARRIRLRRVRSRTAEQTSLAIRCTACFEVEDDRWTVGCHKSVKAADPLARQIPSEECGPV